MKFVSQVGKAIVCAALCSGLTAVSSAQTQEATGTVSLTPAEMSKQMQLLQQQVNELRGELAAIKQSEGAQQHTVTDTSAQSNFVADGSAAKPATAPTLSSLLGSTTLSGFVDGFYGYNFNAPASRLNTLRSFDVNANQFSLNMMELIIDKQPDAAASRTGYHIAVGFGQAINTVNASDPGGLGWDQYLKEAYFSYLSPVGKGLQFDVGKFVTPFGYEVIETKDNWNYTRGLNFSYGIPYYHYGIRAKYAFNDKYSLSAYATNGWNNIIENNTRQSYGATFNWNPNKKWGVVTNYMIGPEEADNNSNIRQLWEGIVSYNVNSKLTFAVDYDYGRGDRIPTSPSVVYWTGVAGYAHYAFTGNSSATIRYEYYNDKYGFTTGNPQALNEFTGTFEHLIGHHLIPRLEFRHDMSNQPVFAKGIGQYVFAQNTLDFGMIFTFDTKEAAK